MGTVSAKLIATAIAAHEIAHTSEEELQDGIAQILQSLGVEFSRETILDGAGRDRIDFLAGGIGIEVKIKGGLSDLTRQLFRYTRSPRIDELLVVSTRAALRRLPEKINGKRVGVVYLCPL